MKIPVIFLLAVTYLSQISLFSQTIFSQTIFTNTQHGAYQRTAPKLYVNFISHNEDADQFNNFPAYLSKRNMIIQFVDMLVAKNMKHNFQSDWTFLKAVARFDTGSVVTNTNGKNIIKWMVEDRGIECDPHSHESTLYNYADVAYLHEALGITPTKITGGFLYDTVVNGNNWENLEAGIFGRYYTSYFWKPDILWGGGTRNHVNDPNIFGAFKPKSMAQFYTHDSTKHLTLIGNGCSIKIFDTTNINSSIAIFRNILNAIENHTVPDTGFYTMAIFVSNVTLTTNIINKVSALLDTLAPYVASGKIQYNKISETYNIWNTEYNKKPFYLNCENLPTGIYNSSGEVQNELINDFYLYQNYPNPFNPVTVIRFQLSAASNVNVRVYDVMGKEIAVLAEGRFSAGMHSVTFDASLYNASSGVYYYRVTGENTSETKKMVMVK